MNITLTGTSFRDSLIKKIDKKGDVARLLVVGDAARVEEYKMAKEHADIFMATGEAKSGVASWAVAKGWTNQQAAEDILAASARWYGALEGIRALRLQAKEDIRNATSKAQAEAVVATFEATIDAAMVGVA